MPGLAALARLGRERLAGLGHAWSWFWFQNSPTTPLEIVRIGIGAAVLFHYAMATPFLFDLWGDAGWMSRAAALDSLSPPWTQSIFFYFTAPWQWIAFHVVFLLCCAAFMVGWRTSWVKWIVLIGQISYDYRNLTITYGADSIVACLLFILCLAPIGRAMSLDRVRAVRAAKRGNLAATLPPYSSPWAGACTRLMQIQMAVLFLYSGIEKVRWDEWWGGDAIWLAFTTYEFYNPILLDLFARQYWLVNVITYTTILIEVAFPFLIWQRRTRPYLLAAAILLHLTFAVFLSLVYFAFVMITGHMSFVRPEWLHRLGAWWKRRIGDMEMVYDGQCGFCVRSMVWFLAFDGLGQIKIRDFRTNPSPVVSDAQLEKALYAVLPDGRALPGFEAYRYVVPRVPGLWWLVPFFYVPGVSRLLGHRIYNWVAANRSRLSAVTGGRWAAFSRARAKSMPPKLGRSHRASPWANLALLLISSLLSLVLIEMSYRAAAGLPVFKLANWRTEQVRLFRFGAARATADPVLGWTNSPWTDSDNFETIDYGIRKNFDETTVRTGAMLAVGDSFTEGWEVKGDESWPAVLESMAGVPVVNAGIGAYGTDQIVLRAEQLLPIVKPKILIIGFLEDDIFRAGYSIFGAPKPYFTTEHGELRYHPPQPLEPRERGSLMSSIGYTLRDGLGYFATADYVLSRLNPDYWYGTAETFDRRIDNDEAEVTCALLRRLKTQTDKAGIPAILFMQYTAQAILESNKPTRPAQNVVACAQDAGIRVADQFSFMQGIAAGGTNALRQYYMYRDNNYGHMSALGNWEAAHLLSTALQDWLEVLPATH